MSSAKTYRRDAVGWWLRPAPTLIAAVLASLATMPIATSPAGGADEQQEQVQLWTCGMHPQGIQDKPGSCPICGMALTPLQVDTGASGSAILIDPIVVQNMGVRTAPVTEGTVYTRVRAVGYLEEPEPNHLDINLRVSGWIEKLYANVEGMHVHAGAPLFDLYSPDLQVAIEELIASRRARGPATDSGGVSKIYDSARRKLELLGLTRDQVDKLAQAERAPATITFVSPMTGHITEKAVYAGAAVKAGDRVLRLADRSTMWLDLQVYEQDLPLIHVGEKVTATVAALPGVRLEGEISFLHPHLDPVSRTARARLVLDNSDGRLRQGMFASADVRSKLAERALLVPREAVIDTGTRQLAFAVLGDGRFEPREVTMGAVAEEGMVQVLSGLALGENVVTSGQFLLDAESRLREAIRKHLSDKLSVKRPVSEVGHDQHSH